MKCRFDYTRAYEILEIVFICFLPISPFIITFFSFPELSVRAIQTMFWVTLAVVVAAVLAVGTVRSGMISADNDKLYISRLFCGRNVFIRTVPYENVEYVLCQPEAKGLKYGRVAYELVLTLKIKNRNEMNFVKKLKFRNDFPVRQSKKFKKYIDEQPLMQMCMYINERLKMI